MNEIQRELASCLITALCLLTPLVVFWAVRTITKGSKPS